MKSLMAKPSLRKSTTASSPEVTCNMCSFPPSPASPCPLFAGLNSDLTFQIQPSYPLTDKQQKSPSWHVPYRPFPRGSTFQRQRLRDHRGHGRRPALPGSPRSATSCATSVSTSVPLGIFTLSDELTSWCQPFTW